MDADSKDEKVNGAKIAAEILERMRPENKKRILKEIQVSDPTLAGKIEQNLFNFDQINELTPQSVQLLLKEVSAQDLILALKTASEAARNTIYANMSERKVALVKSEIEALPPTRVSEIEGAQKRIIEKLEELRSKGLIRSLPKQDVWV